MANDLQTIWQAEGTVDSFTKPEDLMKRTTKFERTIRRRNIVEYAAGGVAAVGSVAMAVMFAGLGEYGIAVSMALVALGAIVVMWNLHSRASTGKPDPEADCRGHLVAQYRRQAEALRKVPLWYIGPLLPGVLGVYATMAFKAAGRADVWDILGGIGQPLGFTLAFFAFVIWLNLRAARTLARKAEELEQA